MASELSEEERRGYEAFLKRLKAGEGQLDESETRVFEASLERIHKNRGFLPDGKSYELYCGLRPLAVIELAILHPSGEDRFLLKYRTDEHFSGWHFPGGTLQNKKTFEQSCSRHATMDKVADGVTNLRIVSAHPYQEGEHPFQYPLILLVACDPVGEVVESDSCRWFSDAPQDIIKNAPHTAYVRKLQEWFKGGRKQHALHF